jgi:hypothetical protein
MRRRRKRKIRRRRRSRTLRRILEFQRWIESQRLELNKQPSSFAVASSQLRIFGTTSTLERKLVSQMIT